MIKIKTEKEYITKANLIHNNKYNYEQINYKSSLDKLNIICPVHGLFNQRASTHLNGCGCPKCAKESISLGTKFFILKSNIKHNNKYDYSKSIYINNKSKIIIICPEHGEFLQLPKSHLKGSGCLKCKHENQILTTENFINRCKFIHNNYYNYDKTVYINSYIKVTIICPIHGDFKQNTVNHLRGQRCPKCIYSKNEEFIESYLKKNNIKFKAQARFDNCKYKKKLPFDFYLPDYNLLIEYHGEQHFIDASKYWTTCKLEYRQKLDKIKKDFALNNNFNYLEITYKDNIEEQLNKILKRN